MNRIIRTNPRSPAWVLLTTLLIVVSVGFAGVAAQDPYSVSVFSVALLAVVASTRAAGWRVLFPLAAAPARRRVLLVGSGPTARRLAPYVEQDGGELVGCVEDAPSTDELPSRLLGSRAALPDLVRELEIDRIIVTDAPAETWTLLGRVDAPVGCDIDIVPGPYELALCPPGALRLGDVALMRLPRRAHDPAHRLVKRAVDLFASALLLLVLSPVLALAMLAIRLSSPGPAIFRQERVGRGGRRFQVLKLRTMIQQAEQDGPRLCAGRSDPRLTPIGRVLRRTHLDELPQLWNVLRGEMSLVGPRPERPEFVEQFERDLPEYRERHRVLPGITGLAQVYGFYHSSPQEKLRYDLVYLYHGSLRLDLKILLRTLLTVFG